jgi:hypothetical protein
MLLLTFSYRIALRCSILVHVNYSGKLRVISIDSFDQKPLGC